MIEVIMTVGDAIRLHETEGIAWLLNDGRCCPTMNQEGESHEELSGEGLQ